MLCLAINKIILFPLNYTEFYYLQNSSTTFYIAQQYTYSQSETVINELDRV